MKKELKNSCIFLFVPSFFDYYKAIISELKKMNVKQIDVVLENFVEKSLLYRFFVSKSEMAKKLYTQRYYKKRINELWHSYDYILVIRGEAISSNTLQLLKKKNPNAKFIMYQWDSVRNNPNCLKIQQSFDYIYTFDPEDAKKYNWRYRPLFFTKKERDDTKAIKDIDFSMVGTLYYKRAMLFNKIREYCNAHQLFFLHHIYCPKFVFLLHKYVLRDKKYACITKDDVKFYPMDMQSLNEIYERSKILVDYTADDQTGLTMRTIECLGHRCKLITNNKNIIQEDIYKYGNIYVYDINNFNIPNDFIESNYMDLPEQLNNYYSLSGWIESIFADVL